MSENYLNKVLETLDENPDLLDTLIHPAKEDAPVTRGMPSASQASDFVRSILGSDVDEREAASVRAALADNPVVQLYEAADGAIDASELLKYVGGLTPQKANTSNKAVKALFDGKLNLSEIIMIIMLLKMFKKKQQQQQQSYYNMNNLGLLGTLLGGNAYANNNNSYFSNFLGSSNSYNTNNSLFSQLLGVQPQQQTNPLAQLFGLGQTQQVSSNPLASLFGGSQQTQSNDLASVLNNFVNGGYNNNAQANQLYNLLSGASQNSFNSNGTVNVGSLFNLLGGLMG